MTQFLKTEAATRRIVAGIGRPDPVGFTGTPDLCPMPHDGFVYREWQGLVNFGAALTPTCAYEWTDAGPAWIDYGDLDVHRARKNDEINAAWIRADSGAFAYADEQFRAGADDVLRLNSINGYISLMNEMPPDWIGAWKTMADTFIELPDVESWKPFYTAFVMKGVTNYLAAQGLKALLAAATTVAEIAAITWPE